MGGAAAHATPRDTQTANHQVQAVDPAVWVDLAIKAYSAFNSGGGIDQAALDAAVREIKAAITAAKTEIIAHIDAALVVFADTCVQGFQARAENIDKYSGVTLEQEAINSVNCAIFVSNTLRTVQDQALAEHVGQLVGPIYAMAAALNGRAGFTINGLMSGYASISSVMITKLVPNCTETLEYAHPEQQLFPYLRYGCTASEGTHVYAVEWLNPPSPMLYHDATTNTYIEVTRAWVRDTSGQNTSWAEAVVTLPRLQALGF